MTILEFIFIGLCFMVSLLMFIFAAATAGIIYLIMKDQLVRVFERFGRKL